MPISILYQKDFFTIRTNYSSGFRPPHISEMLADGVHHGTNRYEIGSKELNIEYANQFDFKYQWSNNHLGFIFNPFTQYISDFISINPTDSFSSQYRIYNYSQFDKVELKGFEINPTAEPIKNEMNFDEPVAEETPTEEINEGPTEEFEPMFGVGMFDEPIPDSTGISSSSVSSTHRPRTTTSNYYSQTGSASEGGEFGKFASEVIKSDVKNYLRLGNAAWAEKRLERAEEHYKRATEVDPEEPRAWHNLAICNYHLALKRNPENVKGAVQSAFALLEVAREKGGREYTAPNETLKYFASQLGLIEEETD